MRQEQPGGQSHAHKNVRQVERRQPRSPGGQLGCLGDSPLRLGNSPLRMNTPTWGR